MKSISNDKLFNSLCEIILDHLIRIDDSKSFNLNESTYCLHVDIIQAIADFVNQVRKVYFSS
jgi:hypothetical protein